MSAQRRPSSERPRGSLKCDTNLEAAPYEIRELLGESHHWDFNIIKLEQLTEKRLDTGKYVQTITMKPGLNELVFGHESDSRDSIVCSFVHAILKAL